MARQPDRPHADGHPDRPDGGVPGPGAHRWAARRRHLERSLRRECDIDPMILRARQLRLQGSLSQAASVEQELLPLL
jgi:hypothetical protein